MTQLSGHPNGLTDVLQGLSMKIELLPLLGLEDLLLVLLKSHFMTVKCIQAVKP